MFLKNYHMIFVVFLVLGTSIAISSNSWFTCWLGLEINLMSLIPLILSELNFKSTEAAIKYFLAQAMASVILITIACIETTLENNFFMTNLSTVIFISLAIKAGLAPFHFWFPQVMNCVSWVKCAIILTWQKIAPFILMSFFFNKKIIYFLILTAAAIGALGGLNQIDSKLLLTYSSISHSAWMLLMSSISLMSWALYFLAYIFIIIPIISSLMKFDLIKITEINKTKSSAINKNFLIFMFLSLGGLPPFLGFSAKLVAIFMSVKIFSLMILILLVAFSLLSLFYYTKLFYSLLMNSMIEIKINQLNEMSLSNKMMFISVLGNLLMSFMVLLI